MGCDGLRRSQILRCDIVQATAVLKSKDTLPLHIWNSLLRGLALLFQRLTQLLSLEIAHCLEICLTERKKASTPRAPLLSINQITPSHHPYLRMTPLDLSQYLLSHSEENVRRRAAENAQLIDLIQAGENGRGNDSLKSDSFGPQDDFKDILDSEMKSVRLSFEDVKVDLGGLEPLAVPEQLHNANLATIRKGKKQKTDKSICLTKAVLRHWLVDTSDITSWHMSAPKPAPPFLGFTLLEALRVQFPSNPTALAADVELQESVPGLEDRRDSFLGEMVDLELLPELEIPQELVDVEFATPQAAAPLPDLQLPSQIETSFTQVQAENSNLKPASVFLKLLEMVQAGHIELVQSEPWAPLQVLPVSR